jgi:hypothetical protein
MTETATESVAVEPRPLRPSHRRVLQLFARYGAMTDSEALEAAKVDNWDISPSGLRSRRAELCPPRGAGIKDSGRKRKIGPSAGSTVWELDPDVNEPFITVGGQ